MKKPLFILSLLLLSTTVFCQDWIYVGMNDSKDKYYIKSEYVSKTTDEIENKDVIKIWIKIISEKQTIKRITYRNSLSKSLWEIDCRNKEYRVATIVVYNSSGKVIQSTTSDAYGSWDNAVPDTIGEAVLNKVCSLFN